MARLRQIRVRNDVGGVSAEYAVATVAACGFGGLLIKLLTSSPVQDLLFKAIKGALNLGF